MDNRPIGIFDSGVGGLSVLLEIEKLLPNEAFVFVADQGHMPYGGKTKKELEVLTDKILNFLASKNVKAVVIACNTATVYTIDYLREKYKIPIIGTAPVIKTIASISKTKKTAVFSTPATAKSDYLSSLIKKFADGVIVYKVGGTGLEELIEAGELENPKTDKILRKYLTPLLKKNVDSIALGCTHYPFLKEKIQKIVGPNVAVVDSGGAVARRLRAVLTNENFLSSEKNEDLYYTTGNVKHFRALLQKILGKKIKNIYSLNL